MASHYRFHHGPPEFLELYIAYFNPNASIKSFNWQQTFVLGKWLNEDTKNVYKVDYIQVIFGVHLQQHQMFLSYCIVCNSIIRWFQSLIECNQVKKKIFRVFV